MHDRFEFCNMALPAIYNNETNIHIYIGCIKDGGDVVEYYRVPRNKTWTKLAAQNRDESISWKVPRHLFVFKELPGSLIIVNDFRQSKPFNNATAREFSKIFRTKSKKQFPWNRGPRRRSIVRDFSANNSSILSRAREKGIKKLFARSPDEIAPLYRHSPLNSTVTSQFCNELQLPRKWEHWLHCFLLVSYPFARYSCNIFVSFC